MGKLALAFRCFFRVLREAEFADCIQGYHIGETNTPPYDAKNIATAPQLITLLQEEGRLIDFLQENIAEFDDSQVGGAARSIHSGCKKAIDALFKISSVLNKCEGEEISLAAGFDPKAIQLVGQISGEPPFHGMVKHHGWKIETLEEPSQQYIVAQAEVEI